MERVVPQTLAEASHAMSGGRARGGPCVVVEGAGTKRDWGAAPEQVDRIVATRGLRGVTDYDPADMTATLGAGTPLRQAQDHFAEHRQWLAVDPPHPEATVGGVFATGDFGPSRLRYGTLRDLVIGATFVLADGTVARSGSKVIKNVAGFDLCKLFAGSLGTLGLVAQITVRLHPQVPARVLRVACSAADATRLGLAVARSPFEPVAVDHEGEALWVRFEGPEVRLDAAERHLENLAGRWVRGDEGWRAHREGIGGEEGELGLRLGALPDQGDAVRAALDEVAPDARGVHHVALGIHRVRARGDEALVAALRDRMAHIGGYAVVERGASGIADPFGPTTAMPLMRRLKAALDPDRRCAPGRFVGGL